MKKILLLIALFLFVSCEETSSSEDESFQNPIVVLDDVDSSPVTIHHCIAVAAYQNKFIYFL
jgi:uncharacterized lipoprotein YajG